MPLNFDEIRKKNKKRKPSQRESEFRQLPRRPHQRVLINDVTSRAQEKTNVALCRFQSESRRSQRTHRRRRKSERSSTQKPAAHNQTLGRLAAATPRAVAKLAPNTNTQVARSSHRQLTRCLWSSRRVCRHRCRLDAVVRDALAEASVTGCRQAHDGRSGGSRDPRLARVLFIVSSLKGACESQTRARTSSSAASNERHHDRLPKFACNSATSLQEWEPKRVRWAVTLFDGRPGVRRFLLVTSKRLGE